MGACVITAIVKRNGYVTRVQILDEIVCISPSAKRLGKGTNPIILPSAIGKLIDKQDILILVYSNM